MSMQLKIGLLRGTVMFLAVWLLTVRVFAEPIDIGTRLEPFVDRHLIETMTGEVKLELQKPSADDVVFSTDKPWEGNTSAYYTIFQDGPLYRMFYRGSHFDTKTRKNGHREVTCYAESTDGLVWKRPELGLFDFDGSKANNIVWDGVGTHNFTPMKDANPNCSPDAKYKALARASRGDARGLYAFQSTDAIHWKLMRDQPVITQGAFDSQNLAFWDTHRGRYVDFHRGFRDGVRDIMTCGSADFLEWTTPEWLKYPGAPKEHLYTNAVRPYPKAPHLLIGFPTRYHPTRGSQVEPTLMTSRDGRTFQRWTEPLIPVSAPKDRDGNRSNYMAWGLVQLPGNQRQWSVYATEAYYTGAAGRLRRFTYRIDGLVAVRASKAGGELLTKPLTFRGSELVINFVTSGTGSVRVGIEDTDGKPIPGFKVDESETLRGDRIEQVVRWKHGTNTNRLTGTPIRLRFVLEEAAMYSIQFR